MARGSLPAPLPCLPWAGNVHSLPKRSFLPTSVLFFLCVLPPVTPHPVKNDLQIFHLLKPLLLTSISCRGKMDWNVIPKPAAKPITKGDPLTPLPQVVQLVRQMPWSLGSMSLTTLCAGPSHTSKICASHCPGAAERCLLLSQGLLKPSIHQADLGGPT